MRRGAGRGEIDRDIRWNPHLSAGFPVVKGQPDSVQLARVRLDFPHQAKVLSTIWRRVNPTNPVGTSTGRGDASFGVPLPGGPDP